MAEDELDELRRKVGEIHAALLGTYDCQGLVSRLRTLENRAATVNKIMVAIGTAVLALMVNAIKALFV